MQKCLNKYAYVCMDQSIIRTLKLKAYILTQIEMSTNCDSELLKDVNVLNAI